MDQIIENFKRVFNQSTSYEKELAKNSYYNYNTLTTYIAKELGFPSYVGPAVFSALSPNSTYFGNLQDVRILLEAKRAGKDISEFKVHTYGNNKRKAWRIADCQDDPLNLIVAKKTRNFYLNCLNPSDPYPVTCDGHVYNASRYIKENLVGLRGFSDRRYEELAEGIRILAKELNILPNQLQGVIWVTWRRLIGFYNESQTEFWSKDKFIAGLIK